MISLGKGTGKMPKTLTLSFPPEYTCRIDSPCFRDCGARQGRCNFGVVKNAWQKNWHLWQADPIRFERMLVAHIGQARHFRYFVGGDCPTPSFMSMTCRVATACSNTLFLMYTKRYDFVPEELPRNLIVLRSAWPSVPMTPDMQPRTAWVYLDVDPRCPPSAFSCPYDFETPRRRCDQCRVCWHVHPDMSIRFKFKPRRRNQNA